MSTLIKALRERHRVKHNTKQVTAKLGDVVLIRGEQRNRGKWQIGIIESFVISREGVIRGARLRAGKSYLERPVQHLFPMELSCDRNPPDDLKSNSKEPEVEIRRPTRTAAVAARKLIADIATSELDELD